MSGAVLALRTYARYAVPLTLLSVVVLAPLLYVAFRVPPPKDPIRARAALHLAWMLAGSAWMFQLVLVGAAAPLARAIARGEAPSQLRALGIAAVHLARGAVPALAAIAAVALGGLALVVPGLVLLVLFSLAAASPLPGLRAALEDSATCVREHARTVIAIVIAMLAIDLAIALVAKHVLVVPLGKRMAPAQLAAYRDVVRTVAVACVAVSPMIAAALAAVRARRS